MVGEGGRLLWAAASAIKEPAVAFELVMLLEALPVAGAACLSNKLMWVTAPTSPCEIYTWEEYWMTGLVRLGADMAELLKEINASHANYNR